MPQTFSSHQKKSPAGQVTSEVVNTHTKGQATGREQWLRCKSPWGPGLKLTLARLNQNVFPFLFRKLKFQSSPPHIIPIPLSRDNATSLVYISSVYKNLQTTWTHTHTRMSIIHIHVYRSFIHVYTQVYTRVHV